MDLNIKSDEAHRLARELAGLTGESMTSVVTQALKEKLARQRRKGLADRLMAIGKDCAERLANAPGKMLEIEDLYDEETGLPK